MNTKYIAIVQCEIAHRRCSGFACSNAFYNKEEMFDIYDNSTRYISFTCGGCCGKGIAAKLEHFSKKLKRKTDINKNEVAIHLASCIVTDNHHYDRCPHVEYIKSIILKKGYKNIVEGSYISNNAKMKRKQGVYSSY